MQNNITDKKYYDLSEDVYLVSEGKMLTINKKLKSSSCGKQYNE